MEAVMLCVRLGMLGSRQGQELLQVTAREGLSLFYAFQVFTCVGVSDHPDVPQRTAPTPGEHAENPPSPLPSVFIPVTLVSHHHRHRFGLPASTVFSGYPFPWEPQKDCPSGLGKRE